jgi:Leucine-rich repeat (LRR) protein
MIKLNIFLLFNFFLIINSEICQNYTWVPCNCSTNVLDPNSENKELELSFFYCEKPLEKLPEIQNIKSIYLDATKMSSFPNNLISNENCFYKNITRLVFRNTNLSSINNSDFKCLSKLEMIDLSLNEISVIDADVFKNLTELNELLLINNKITKVDHNSFCGLSKLILLDLQINLITSLPENICFPTQIKYLYLSYNKIKSKIL